MERDLIQTYTLTELVKKEKLSTTTIKKRIRDYIPLKVENAQSRANFKRGSQKRDYTIRYIRRKDFEKYMKENGFEYFLLR